MCRECLDFGCGICGKSRKCCDRCGEDFEAGVEWRIDDEVICTDCWEHESSASFWAFVKSDEHGRARRRERAFLAVKKSGPGARVTVRRQLAIWYNVNFVPVPYKIVRTGEL